MSAEHATGTVAEEAMRLLEALQQAAGRWHRGTVETGQQEPGAEPPTTCRVCPFCQLLAAVQHVRPETLQHLADAAASFTAALGDLVPAGGGASRGRPPSSTPRPGPRPPDGDLQRIDITD